MQPTLNISRDRVKDFRELFEDPVTFDPMTEAVSLVPCGHSLNEDSLRKLEMDGAGERKEHKNADGDDKSTIKLVRPIECPIDRRPVSEYVKNWSLRAAAAQLDHVFEPVAVPHVPAPAAEPQAAPQAEPAAAPQAAPRPAPRIVLSLKDRFAIVTTMAFGALGTLLAPMYQYESTKVREIPGDFFGWFPSTFDSSMRDNNTRVALMSSVATAAIALFCFTVTSCIIMRKMR